MNESDKFGDLILKTELRAPVGLLGKIFSSIARRERRTAILKFGVYSGASALATALFTFSWGMASAALQESGTASVFSLIFSDFQSVLGNWSYFTLSLAESLPTLSLIYLLLSALALSILVSLAVTNLKNAGRLRPYGLKHA
ncbi:hypothetical protein D4R51_02850 [bacterium]|nr:MAG: hypothetical protein D4R51_02850 [bacterium]